MLGVPTGFPEAAKKITASLDPILAGFVLI
jgi:hypothetical protein